METLVTLAMVSLLAASFLPSLSRAKARARRASCICHLKQIGLSFRIYSNDRGHQYPWKIPVAQAGSLEYALSPQVFRHFAVASNELATPKILTCPTDLAKNAATGFNSFSNTNLSYFVNIDADETNPQSLLSGDRNIQGGLLSQGYLLTLTSTSAITWTTELHNRFGNVGLADGSAQQLSLRSTSFVAGARLLIP